MKWILSFLLFTTLLARAQGPDQEYIRIYNLISQADAVSVSTNANPRLAADQYRQAHAALKRLQSIYPQWNENVIKFRLNYVAGKLEQYSQPPIANAAPETSGTPATRPQSGPWIEEMRRLQADNALLEAKLKEALSVQPSGSSSSELAKLEEKTIALQKERDLLKVALEQQSASKTVEADATESARVRQLERERDELKKRLAATSDSKKEPRGDNREIEQLRARLEALEARPEPYTSEELALFRQTAPELAPAESKPLKKSKELPPGSGALVAQAERAFAARQFAEAEQKYLEVLRQDEDNVYVLGNLAAIQLEMNKVSAAEKNISRALEADPDDAFSLTLLGMIKFRENKFDEALNALSRSAKIDPNNPETQNYLGITLSQKGQRAAAEAALRKAIQVQPNYGGAHHNLAVIYATQKPPFLELARWHYEKALALGHAKNADLEKLIGSQK